VSGPSRASAAPGGSASRPGPSVAREGAVAAAGPARSERASGASRSDVPPARPGGARPVLLTFARLKWASFTHSAIYLALLLSAFAAGKPEPLTQVLGWTHGLLWISMSLACLTAARRSVVPLRVAVAVAVLGGVGPFFGSLEFTREQRRRVAEQRQNAPR
jgi:hypothetical protein